MKRILAGATLGALFLSNLAGAETYQFHQRVSGLQEVAKEPTGPSPVEGVIYDEDGWALAQRFSTGIEPDVTDEQWVQLRDAMSMGIRVEFTDGVEWFSSAEALRAANCQSISDTDSLRTLGAGGFHLLPGMRPKAADFLDRIIPSFMSDVMAIITYPHLSTLNSCSLITTKATEAM